METLTTLKNRRSCRAYKAEHVEEEKLNAIIEAGTYAPTGMGKLVVTDLISDRLTLEELPDAMAKVRAGARKVVKMMVLS